jgi:hypothetical protein
MCQRWSLIIAGLNMLSFGGSSIMFKRTMEITAAWLNEFPKRA